jgi:hypothetical protein
MSESKIGSCVSASTVRGNGKLRITPVCFNLKTPQFEALTSRLQANCMTRFRIEFNPIAER